MLIPTPPCCPAMLNLSTTILFFQEDYSAIISGKCPICTGKLVVWSRYAVDRRECSSKRARTFHWQLDMSATVGETVMLGLILLSEWKHDMAWQFEFVISWSKAFYWLCTEAKTSMCHVFKFTQGWLNWLKKTGFPSSDRLAGIFILFQIISNHAKWAIDTTWALVFLTAKD